jgi:hypothetical protein
MHIKPLETHAALVSPATSVFDPLEPTVFHQSWWLHAASAGAHEEVTVRHAGRIVGRFPFVIRRHLQGLRTLCGMPELTHFLGPAIDEGSGAPCNRAVKRALITRQLLAQLPKTTGFRHTMHAGVNDMLEFQRAGLAISVEFTYEVKPEPEKILWRNMRDKTRNVIRRAQEQMEVFELDDPGEFISSYNRNLQNRGRRNRYDDRTIERLCLEAMRRGQGRIIAVRDQNRDINAAVLCVWDCRVAYYLLSTRSAAAGNGAVSLLIWHAMRDSASRGLVFDFEGVGTPGSGHFYNGFGGTITPRYSATRYTPIHRTLDHFNRWLRRPM